MINRHPPLGNILVIIMKLSTSALIAASLGLSSEAFVTHKSSGTYVALDALSPAVSSLLDETFTPPDTMGVGEITEQACADAAMRMNRVKVPVPEYVSDSGEVGVSFIHWPAEKKTSALPIILVHGFDSSSLEYRRLGPKLAALGVDVYSVCLLGWGYSQLQDVKTFSAQAKVDALKGFWEIVGSNKPVAIAGASLGGAAAIEFAAANQDIVKGCVFIDAQGFVDGVGPMQMLPRFLAEAGVQVLKSVPLRNSANQMSYFDTETYATEDALKVGRLHCLQEGWSDALVSFMLSGGFSPSKKVPTIESPSLILWGRQDTILEIEFAEKFLNTLPDAELKWIEECGHVPHLEQSEQTANEIANFLMSDKFTPVRNEVESSSFNFGELVNSIFSK